MKARQHETSTKTTPPTVLIVDDEPDIVVSLRSLIEDEMEGTHTLGAASAHEGLAVLAQDHVDLIVSDFRMPGMDGIDFLREAERRWPDVPAILVTAFADGAVAVRASRETHVAAFMAKPVDSDRLLRLVRTVLESRGL